jgi:flagellum-specific peptidoglycan hydrolase FlgJ
MKYIVVLISSILFIGCSTNRIVSVKRVNDNSKSTVNNDYPSKKELEIQNKDVVSILLPTVNNTPINTSDKVALYVHKYNAVAQYEMQNSGIPASITLAQGILESGAGNGDLTQRANNHFGIKCHDWNGEKVYHDDDKKGECFRKYSHPSESFKDHSNFLTSRPRYASLFKLHKNDYEGWAKGLRKAGYATDPKYPSKLISLIKRYDLYKYDELTFVSSKTSKNITEDKYRIQKGDTLYSVARKFNLSVSNLMKLNNLKTSSLSIGQQLIVK